MRRSEQQEYRKRLIDSLVNPIYVFDDKLILTFNYQHGTQTVSLAEIEAFSGPDLDGSSPPKHKGDENSPSHPQMGENLPGEAHSVKKASPKGAA